MYGVFGAVRPPGISKKVRGVRLTKRSAAGYSAFLRATGGPKRGLSLHQMGKSGKENLSRASGREGGGFGKNAEPANPALGCGASRNVEEEFSEPLIVFRGRCKMALSFRGNGCFLTHIIGIAKDEGFTSCYHNNRHAHRVLCYSYCNSYTLHGLRW